MRPAAYFDSSVLVKLYDPEEGGAERVRALVRSHTRCASSLLYAEVISTFARKRRMGEVDGARLERALRSFRADYQTMTVVELSREVLLEAERILLQYPLRAPDAIHLASACILRGMGTKPPVVTADRRLATAAQAE
ncbi:MAG: type II toxin-antitoxin system VapC family toxin, partial [Deltaproteobacteria bacterium]|nr:type II toxin-antitoxin system VapC family toxin [Deltaproteobacteria bacterium]